MTTKLLQVAGGMAPERELVLHHFPTLIGRSADADVLLTNRHVSRRHCQIEEAGGRLFIRDLGSTNGTWINGLHVAQSPLLSGDRLRLGDSVFLVVNNGGKPSLLAIPTESTYSSGLSSRTDMYDGND